MATPESNIPYTQLARARHYKAEFLKMMFGSSAAAVADESDHRWSVFECLATQPNIIGLGFGLKMASGAPLAEEEAVRVYVREKLAPSLVSDSDSVPAWINGLPTDVVPLRDLVAAGRPQPCGVSIGHHAITAGTLGCLVRKSALEDGYYILSNNHVLADCDKAAIGDSILEPGPKDGGKLDDPIAFLSDFEPIMHGNIATFDAAIARLIDPNSVTRDIREIGNVQLPTAQVVINQSVLKCGRTTNLTEGRIVGLDEDVTVRYGQQKVNFEGQLAIIGVKGPFGKEGDSGSLVLDADTKNPVGLFFAADLWDPFTGFANPIDPILERFEVEILG
jgi:hypothetical protein